MTAPVAAGFFSFTVVPAGSHHAFNEWHLLDHLPEQYSLPGIAHGARWVATPACVAARAASSAPELAAAQYLTLYLMSEPVGPTLKAFADLAVELRAADRFFRERESMMFGAWQLDGMAASTAVLVRPSVLPWRAATAVYAVVEDVAAPAPHGAEELEGVAGWWSFVPTTEHTNPTWRLGPYRITVLWLDGDLLITSAGVGDHLRERAVATGIDPVLAGPYEPIARSGWDWFDGVNKDQPET